jgi:hypothetical protein
MTVQKSVYESSLAQYSNHLAAIALLKQHRPYLEMIPSLRHPCESVITIPLPIEAELNKELQEVIVWLNEITKLKPKTEFWSQYF